MFAATAKLGVVFAPGRSFYPSPPKPNTLRLTFTHANDAEMEKGLKLLGREIWNMRAS